MRSIAFAATVTGYNGDPMTQPNPSTGQPEVVNLWRILDLFFENLPPGVCESMADMATGFTVAGKVHAAFVAEANVLELEDAEYIWLLAKIGTAGPSLFRINAVSVKAAVETEPDA